MIEKPEWWERYENPIVRQYIIDLCKSYCPRSPKLQEILYYEGWTWINRCLPGKKAEYYMHMGYVGMTRYFELYIRPISHKPFSRSAPYRRAKRTTKKYFKRVVKKRGT